MEGSVTIIEKRPYLPVAHLQNKVLKSSLEVCPLKDLIIPVDFEVVVDVKSFPSDPYGVRVEAYRDQFNWSKFYGFLVLLIYATILLLPEALLMAIYLFVFTN